MFRVCDPVLKDAIDEESERSPSSRHQGDGAVRGVKHGHQAGDGGLAHGELDVERFQHGTQRGGLRGLGVQGLQTETAYEARFQVRRLASLTEAARALGFTLVAQAPEPVVA